MTAGVGQKRDGQRNDTGDYSGKRETSHYTLARLRPQIADRSPQRGKVFLKLPNVTTNLTCLFTLPGSAAICQSPPWHDYRGWP